MLGEWIVAHKKKRATFASTTVYVMDIKKVLIALSIAGYQPTLASEQPDSTALMLDEVVVTGSNKALPARLLPYTVSVVNRSELEGAGSTQLLSVLSGRVPSLFVTERGLLGYGVSNGGSGHIKLRGIGGDRASAVLMMLDGQPQFAGIYSHHVADFYTTTNVERVEVLRGPSSVLYGSNAMAGTINIITRNAKHDGYHGTLTTEYGSYNTLETTLSSEVRRGRWSAFASGSYGRTDGNIDGLTFKQWSGYGKVNYVFSEQWKATVDYAIMNFRSHDPVYPLLSNPESTDVYRQNVTRGEASAAVTNNYGSTDGTARVYYSYGNHYIDDPRHFHSTDDRFGVMLYQNFKPWKGAMATGGFDFATYGGEIPMSGGTGHKPGAMGTISRKSITEYSPYITLAQILPGERLTINGGVRMANSDKFGTRWVPQGGFSFLMPADVIFKASAAMGYRNPSFRELYLYRMANPHLAPERMWNYEMSLARNFGTSFSASLTAYYSKGNNMIQVIDQHNENTGRFINKGIEASAQYRPSSTLAFNVSYSYLHTSLSNLVGAPRHQYFAGAAWKPLRWLTANVEVKGAARLYVAENYKQQSWATLNMKFTAAVWSNLDLSLQLDNISDARYTIIRGYKMPGFTAFGGFKLHI